MSLRFTNSARNDQPADDEEEPTFTTGNDGVTTPATDDETTAPTRPTFTARSNDPATGTVPQPTPAADDVTPGYTDPADDLVVNGDVVVVDDVMVDDTVPDEVAAGNYPVDESVSPAEPVLDPVAEPDPYPASAAEAGSYEATGVYQTAPAATGTQAVPTTATALDGPLLGDATELRGRWQHVQAEFVDDPQEAVGDAADLIEQTAQALVVALRQRQRELRVEWEGNGNGNGQDGATASGTPDTEHLRLIMRCYRGLFNELCRP